MKNLIIIFFIIFYCINFFSQNVEIGVRQNQYLKVEMLMKNGIYVQVENSLFLANLDEQFFRGEIGYFKKMNSWTIKGGGYLGTGYGFDFQVFGVRFGSVLRKGNLSFGMVLQPFYDTGYGYTSCYGINMEFSITKNIKIEGLVTNIPENRIPDSRFRLGLLFVSDQLWVKPEISMPQTGDFNTSRVLLSFGYAL